MTDSVVPPHEVEMLGVATAPPTTGGATVAHDVPPFETVYDTYFPYVWRSIQRLGVPTSQVDDAVQEVFIVVHRRLAEFEARSSIKTWLYGIALRVARAHRVRGRRADAADAIDDVQISAPEATRPDERATNAEAARLVQQLLDGLDDEQREVFVLAELEQLSAPEIARALDVKLNTVYSRLRLARAAFAAAADRHRARDRWRTR